MTAVKNKLFTSISTIMLFLPWSIYYLRTFDWALEHPVAETMIACYIVFMIFSGVFTIVSYFELKVQNVLMKICLVINGIYAAVGTILLAMFINSQIIK